MGRGRGANKKEEAATSAPVAADAPAPPVAAAATATAAATTAKKDEELEDVYEENEVVLAKDGGQVYEAKVMRVTEAKGSAARQYFIHYQGWKSKWDKWVSGDELLKKNETSLKLQAQLRQAAKKRPSGKAAAQGEDGEGGAVKKVDKRGKKATAAAAAAVGPVDPDVEPVTEGSNDPQVKLAMPFTLKKQLVDDWEMVTRYVGRGCGGWMGRWDVEKSSSVCFVFVCAFPCVAVTRYVCILCVCVLIFDVLWLL